MMYRVWFTSGWHVDVNKENVLELEREINRSGFVFRAVEEEKVITIMINQITHITEL